MPVTCIRPARVGTSVVDISCGLNAHAAIMTALFERERTGKGAALKTSLFASASELMAVPLLQQAYTGTAPVNRGLEHPSISPYRAYECSDGENVLISIQNEREWVRLCDAVLQQPEVATDPRFNSGVNRVAHRDELDAIITGVTAKHTRDAMVQTMLGAKIACAAVNELKDVVEHPQLRTVTYATPTGTATVVAPPVHSVSEPAGQLRPVPALGAHTDAIRREFAGAPN